MNYTGNEETFLPLGRQLAVLGRMYYASLTAKLQHIDIDRYYSVLLLLDQCQEDFTQQILGDRLQIDKTSMVRVIDMLEAREYIRREAKADDRRCHRIILTDKGKDIVPEIKRASEELNAEMLAGLESEKAAEFREMLALIFNNLRKMPAEEVIVEYSTKRTNPTLK